MGEEAVWGGRREGTARLHLLPLADVERAVEEVLVAGIDEGKVGQVHAEVGHEGRRAAHRSERGAVLAVRAVVRHECGERVPSGLGLRPHLGERVFEAVHGGRAEHGEDGLCGGSKGEERGGARRGETRWGVRCRTTWDEAGLGPRRKAVRRGAGRVGRRARRKAVRRGAGRVGRRTMTELKCNQVQSSAIK